MATNPGNNLPPSARGDAGASAKLQRLAAQVGVGIHKQFVAPADAKADADTKRPPGEIAFEQGWSEKPSLKGQIGRGPEYWKLDRVEVRVFDLSKNSDVVSYSELLTKTSMPDTNVVLIQNDRQWNAGSGNWMACVEVQHILYRRVLITEKNKDEQAS